MHVRRMMRRGNLGFQREARTEPCRVAQEPADLTIRAIGSNQKARLCVPVSRGKNHAVRQFAHFVNLRNLAELRPGTDGLPQTECVEILAHGHETHRLRDVEVSRVLEILADPYATDRRHHDRRDGVAECAHGLYRDTASAGFTTWEFATIEQQHRPAARRQVVSSSTASGPGTNDDDIPCLHGGASYSSIATNGAILPAMITLG